MSPTKLAIREAKRQFPDATPDELAEAAIEILEDWRAEAKRDREEFGDPEDTPCLEPGRDNCDDWGTGEGQFHGRI